MYDDFIQHALVQLVYVSNSKVYDLLAFICVLYFNNASADVNSCIVGRKICTVSPEYGGD